MLCKSGKSRQRCAGRASTVRRSTRDIGQGVNQEAQDKPVLNAESFQRLLAAAFILQVRNDRTSVQPIGAGYTYPFAAGAIVQKRTPSVLAREPGLQTSRSDFVPATSPDVSAKSAARLDQPFAPSSPGLAPAVTETAIANELAKRQHAAAGNGILPRSASLKRSTRYSEGLMPLVGSMVPHATNIFVSRAMVWRTVEALAIATVFLALVGMSIYRLSALTSRTPLPSEMPEQRNAFQPGRPAANVLTSYPLPVTTRTSRQAVDGGEGDIVAKDIVIRYPKPAVNLPLVQYGADVSMWSRSPNGANLDGLGH
jgi:hypothetical protein